jgi:hypothetical protein
MVAWHPSIEGLLVGHANGRQPFATLPVLLIAAGIVVGLLVLSQWYGFHRDELYFIVAGRHPAFGYPDQPPLTPLLAAAATFLLGVEPFASRVLPAMAAGATVILTAGMAREMQGGTRAQVLAALTMAISGLLAAGHLGSTATYEILLWSVVMWLVIRLLDGADARLWLLVGAVGGIALQNKQTALMLGAGLVGGLLLARRWDVFRSPMLWLGGLIAVVIWAPNLAWQAANGFPQIEMARNIAVEAAENRMNLVPELMLLAGPLLFPISVAGAWRLLRSPQATPWRALGLGFAVLLVLVLVSGGKSYYASGMLGPLMAAGSIATAAWLDRGRGRVRGAMLGLAAACSGVLIAILVLPVLPPPTLAATPLPEIYPESAEQIGWPELVEVVEKASGTLTPAELDRTVVFATNYGEAGAIELLGDDVPPVYSGHNGFGDWGPPPEDAIHTIFIGHWQGAALSALFGDCRQHGRVDNGIDLDNQEQGAGVWVCRGRTRPWQELWPNLRHLS